MAAPTIRRPKWAPGPTAKIDWSHPLAQGCVAYTLPAYAVDLAGQPVVTTGAVVRSTPTPYGLGASGFGAGTIYETVGVTGVPIVGDVATAAITAVFHGATTIVGGNGSSLYAERGSAGSEIANLLYAPTNPAVIRIVWRDHAGTLVNSNGTASISDGVAHVATIVRTSTTTFESWIDGHLDQSVTSGSMTTTFSEATLAHRLGGDAGDTSTPFPGTIVAVILHRNRSLTPNAVAQLHNDPFCMLRY